MSVTGPHLYFATEPSELVETRATAVARAVETPVRRHKMLISFHYARGRDLGEMVGRYFKTFPQIFGDSGAFSAMSLGKPITVDEYAEWLKVNERHLEVYANLDVIRSPEGTERNQRALERKGFRPLPVFHTGSPWPVLERLMDEYPYIALGGCVGYRSAQLMPWLVQCFKRARAKGKGTVFHGFGMTQVEIIRNLPWYSVDSSSWGQGYRYGTLALFDVSTGRFVKLKMFDAKEVGRHAGLFREHGFEPDVFMDRKKYHHSKAAGISAVAWTRLERWMRKRHGRIELPGQTVVGPSVYLADAGSDLGEARLPHIAASVERVGPHLYLADTDKTIHAAANHAISPKDGPHPYLADANTQRHITANQTLGAATSEGEPS